MSGTTYASRSAANAYLNMTPTLTEDTTIAKLKNLRGNTAECFLADGTVTLLKLPKRLNFIQPRPGQYLIVTIMEDDVAEERRVRGTVDLIISPQQAKELNSDPHWPLEFHEKEDDSEAADPFDAGNTNKRKYLETHEAESDSDF